MQKSRPNCLSFLALQLLFWCRLRKVLLSLRKLFISALHFALNAQYIFISNTCWYKRSQVQSETGALVRNTRELVDEERRARALLFLSSL